MRMRIAAPIAIVVAVILPFVVSGYHAYQLAQLLAYAIAILGLNLLTGFSGQISLGNGAFYALGAYTAVISINHGHVPYGVAPVLAGAVCFAIGYLFGLPAARLEGLYLALATFALAVVTPQLLKLNRIEPWTGGRDGVQIDKVVSPIPSVVDDDRWLYLYCLIVAIVMFAIAWNLIRGRTGRALIALRDHPIGAGAMGIDIAAYKATTFGVSAMFTGVAGALGALIAGFISPDSFSILVSIQLLVGGVVGGIASLFGTLFGAAFIEFVPNLANKLSDNAPGVVFGVLLIVCMRLMPGGVAGLVERHLWRSRNG